MASESLPDTVVPDTQILGEIDPKLYNGIVRCARLLSVQLIDSSFSMSPKFFDDEQDVKHSVDFGDVHAWYDKDTRIAACMFQLESLSKVMRKKVFSLKSKYVVYYDIPVDCDETHAKAFARKTGLTACYPYFRNHVSMTAAMANANIPIMPTISAMPVREKIRRDDD